MLVLIHEWVTGGGLAGQALPASWAAEGRAMRVAIGEDFARLPGVEVVMTLDERFQDQHHPWQTFPVPPGREQEIVSSLTRSADYTALIAPETAGILAARAQLIAHSSGHSLGATPSAITLTADKHRLAKHLISLGVMTPKTQLHNTADPLPNKFPYPAVLKPVDGAGSQDTFYLAGPHWPLRPESLPETMILQPFIPGDPRSATFLVSPSGHIQLVAVGRQLITIDQAAFRYRGGRLPLQNPSDLHEPLAAIRSIPGLLGIIGVDFIHDPATSRTTVIEINPRPTTSYVALRRLLPPGALALAWLEVLNGRLLADRLDPLIPPSPRSLQFDPDGSLHKHPEPTHARPR